MDEIYVFGSVCRGEPDPGSDLDVLVIAGKLKKAAYPSSWSVYSPSRLRTLFERGTLFAWHLHEEVVPVWPRTGRHFLAKIGPPAPYVGAPAEVAQLREILLSSVDELIRGTTSTVYELGLISLACRDIAMAAAPILTGSFDFSRHAPFHLPGFQFPLGRKEYDYTLNCRRATTRGRRFAGDRRIERRIQLKLDRLATWSADVLKNLQR